MKNLDVLAAQAAQTIIANTDKQQPTEVYNLITKALGVLQENGVYAALLYLYSRTSNIDKLVAEQTRKELLSLLTRLGLSSSIGYDATTALRFLTDNVCNELDRLLLVKQLWEQTLIYTRYGAKAREAEAKTKEAEKAES